MRSLKIRRSVKVTSEVKEFSRIKAKTVKRKFCGKKDTCLQQLPQTSFESKLNSIIPLRVVKKTAHQYNLNLLHCMEGA